MTSYLTSLNHQIAQALGIEAEACPGGGMVHYGRPWDFCPECSLPITVENIGGEFVVPPHSKPPPSYTHDLDGIMTVVLFMVNRRWNFSLSYDHDGYEAAFGREDVKKWGRAKWAGEAIVIAALDALAG